LDNRGFIVLSVT